MSQYNTNVTLTTNASGNVSFNGTYGLYNVTVGGQTYNRIWSRERRTMA